MKKIKKLESLKGIAEKIKKNPDGKEYWEKEEKYIKEKEKEKDKIKKSIEMGYLKFIKPFTI